MTAPIDLRDQFAMAAERVLRRIGNSGAIATHWLNDAAGSNGDCAKTRRLLKRMEKAELVQGVQASRSGRVFWWTATEKGRALLAPRALTTPKGEDHD